MDTGVIFDLSTSLDEKNATILSWLSDFDFVRKQKDVLKQRLPGTARWILEAPEVKSWIFGKSKSPILWCNGLPGIGRTTSTAVLIDYLQRNVQFSTYAVTYVYGDSLNTDCNDATTLLSSICRQLIQRSPGIPPQLLKLHAKMTLDKERPGIDDIMLLIIAMCDSFTQVFIVVDAICELSKNGKRPILISKLEWMRNHGAKIFISSVTHGERPEQCGCNDDIEEAYSRENVLVMPPQFGDVELFLNYQIKIKDIGVKLLQEAGFVVGETLKSIALDSGGIYKVAKLKLERKLREFQKESEQIDSEPAPIPGATTSHFEDSGPLLDRIKVIKQQHRGINQLAIELLGCVYHAKEPLSLYELVYAIASNGTCRHSYEYRVDDSDALIRETTCRKTPGMDLASPLDDQLSDLGTWDGAVSVFDICEGIIYLGEDHLVKISNGYNVSDQLRAKLFPNCHLFLAKTCLKHLSDDDVIESYRYDKKKTQEDFDRQVTSMPLRWYAKKHWSTHYAACNDLSLDNLVQEYFRKISKSPATWVEKRQPFFAKEYYVLVTDNETPILKVARLGLDRLLEILIRSGEYNINKESWKEETPMSVAVEEGHHSTLQLLYRHGGSIHYIDRFGNGLLHRAAKKNDEVMVELLINCGLAPDTLSRQDSETALHVAARNNSVTSGRILLDHRADPSLESRGRSVFKVAAQAGALEFVKLLVEYGYNISSRSQATNWDTPLQEAVRSGSAPLVQYMLMSGVDVGEKDTRNSTAIHTAAWVGNLEITKLLFEYGADPFVVDDGSNEVCEGSTALGEAITKNHQPIIDFLIPKLHENVPLDSMYEMAVAAAQAGSPDLFKFLISRIPGDLAHQKNATRDHLLGAAVLSNNDEILPILLQRGISTAIQDNNGSTVLMAAVNNAKRSELLLQHQANSNTPTKYGVTAIQLAAYRGFVDTLKILLKYGADLTARADDGSTALIAAGYGSQAEAVKYLLNHGAAINDKNIDGESVLHFAVYDGNSDLVNHLLQYRIDISILSRKGGSVLHLACNKGYFEIVKQLLKFGADTELGYQYTSSGFQPSDVHGFDAGLPWNKIGIQRMDRPRFWFQIEPGWKPLHNAASGGHSEIVSLLIQSGANISGKDHIGQTPLHVASSACHMDVIQILLDNRADISSRDESGNTPLHSAALASVATKARETANSFKCSCQLRDEEEEHRHHEDHTKSNCIRLLMKAGADAASVNSAGQTPLALAIASGHEDIVMTILDITPSKSLPTATYIHLIQNCDPKAPARLLETVCNISSETDETRFAWTQLLTKACIAGNVELVKLALKQGAVISSRSASGDGQSPFLQAIRNENPSMVKLLLENDASPQDTDKNGKNALHIACSHPGNTTLTVNYGNRSKESIVHNLLEYGAIPNSQTPDGDTAMHFAVSTGQLSIVQTLLKFNASVNVRNKEGRTPLHAAVSSWISPEIVECLIKNGASASAQDKAGHTPLHLIRQKGEKDLEIVNILLKNGCDPKLRTYDGDMASHSAIRRGHWPVFKRLLEANISIHTTGAKGRTFLHIGARRGSYASIEPLIKLGANPDALDGRNWTPLHHAIHKQHEETVRVLLKYGHENLNRVATGKAVPLRWVLPKDDTNMLSLLKETRRELEV
jgi:ankyrin repeat protein